MRALGDDAAATVDAEMQQQLAEMYVADDRFRATYNQHADGLAQYVRDAVHAHADAV